MKESLPVSVSINGKTHELDYERELASAEETINENLKSQAPLFAWYAVMQELCDAELAEAKLALEVTESTLDAQIRAELVAAGTKATETMIRGKLVVHEQYIAAVSQLNVLKKNYGVLRAVKEAFNHRKDMLVTLASNMRAQMDPEIFIRKQEFREKK